MKEKTSSKTPYKASSPLILSGGFQSLAEGKAYHALLVLVSMRGWKYNERGEMRVGLGELHRLTQHACENWKEYLTTLKNIRDTIRLDWGHLSRLVGGFNRVGDTPILSEVRADMDLAGDFSEIVFRIPAALLEDVIKPRWFGQVDPKILFSIRSAYAFNAYLYASLTIIEKDKERRVFWSDARPISEWREILGVAPETCRTPSQFRAKIFRRVEEQIAKTTRNTDHPIAIDFTDEGCTKGLYQMRVERIQHLPAPAEEQTAKRPKLSDGQPAPPQPTAKEDAAQARMEAETAEMEEKLRKHPKEAEIRREIGEAGGITYFDVVFACQRLGVHWED